MTELRPLTTVATLRVKGEGAHATIGLATSEQNLSRPDSMIHEILQQLTEQFDVQKVQLAAVIPHGGSGYSQNDSGEITGIKLALGELSLEATQGILESLSRLHTLRRIVIATWRSDDKGPPLKIPQGLASLPNLEFLWISGQAVIVPPELLLAHPVYFPRHIFPAGRPGYDQVSKITSAVLMAARRPKAGSEKEERDGRESEEDLRRVFSQNAKLRLEATNLRGLFFNAALADPPTEIVARGPEALKAYLAGRDNLELPLNEVKVILVGDGGAGKTSLVKRLIGEPFQVDEPQTHGINIKQWHSGDEDDAVKIHMWDFGGQEIMHATHQFFLSKRSVYVVLLDGRREEQAEYWLQHVESFGGESPVLVVINKADQNQSYDVNRKFLQEKYPFIVGFHKISCSRRQGISQFKAALEKAVRRTTILSTRWPLNWFRVKQRLEDAAKNSSYMSLEHFGEICSSEGVADEMSRDVLVDFLHDLGVIVHFRDFHLLDTHVLNPRWVTEGVYKIVNSKDLARGKGVLPLDKLSRVLNRKGNGDFEYPTSKHIFLVELMLKFELCYRVDQTSILVPDLLDIQEPQILDDYTDSAIHFVFEFDYLPKSIIPRFIVRMNRQIDGGKRWRTGVALRENDLGSTAVIRVDEAAKRIYIAVKGGRQREYFSHIRHAFKEIFSSFQKLTIRELVPLPGYASTLIDYDDLLGHERSGRNEYFVGKIGVGFEVTVLLDGLVDRKDRIAESITVVNVGGNYVVGRDNASIRMPSENSGPTTWERGVILGAVVLFFGLVGYLMIRNTPIADPNLVVVLRISLGLIVAVLGAVVPGMLNVGFNAKGLIIRASGALALFVLALLLTPNVLP